MVEALVNIGERNTEISVITTGHVFYSRLLPTGRKTFDETLARHLRNRHNLLIGERTAEAIREALGSAFPLEKPLTMEVRGRHLTGNVPKTIVLTDEEIREALTDAIATIINSLRAALEQLPEKILDEASERGILLKGGAALKNFDKLLMVETGLPVSAVD